EVRVDEGAGDVGGIGLGRGEWQGEAGKGARGERVREAGWWRRGEGGAEQAGDGGEVDAGIDGDERALAPVAPGCAHEERSGVRFLGAAAGALGETGQSCTGRKNVKVGVSCGPGEDRVARRRRRRRATPTSPGRRNVTERMGVCQCGPERVDKGRELLCNG